MLFFSFSFFFQISNDYCRKSYRISFLFYNGFRGFLWSSAMSQIFLIYIFLTMKQWPFQNFFRFPRKCILFFYFFWIKEILQPYFGWCIQNVVHYANLNSSFKNKLYLRAVEFIFWGFFRFLIYVSFNKAFAKTLWKKLSFFNTNFQHLFQDVVLILNLRPFEYRIKFEKNASFLWVLSKYFWHFLKDCAKKVFKI